MALSGVAPGGPPKDGRRQDCRPVPTSAADGNRPPTDEALLEAFYQGDDHALDRLVRRYRWLARFVVSLLPAQAGGRAEKADDIVQIAWVKVMNTRTSCATRWQRQRGMVRPWLLVIVLNCVRDEARKESAVPLGLHEPLDRPDARADDRFAQTELRSVVLQCLDELHTAERNVLILKFWCGKQQTEIAATLAVSEATISRWLTAARADLRTCLLDALRDDDQ